MNRKQYVFERQLYGIRSDGEHIVITVAVGAPYKDDNFNSWACPVKAEGLFNQLPDPHGMNPWQVVQYTRKFIVWLLHEFLDKGGKLYNPGQYKEMTKEQVNELFQQASLDQSGNEPAPASMSACYHEH